MDCSKNTVFKLLLWIHTISCVVSMKSECFGVYDRSDAFKRENLPFLRGTSARIAWADLEPAPEKFDWAPFKATIAKAMAAKQCLYASVLSGPDSPDWLYDEGSVPKVLPDPARTSEKHAKFPKYPFYLDANYKKYYARMIQSVANFFRTHPWGEYVSFFQVMTGSTGDEEPYKGHPLLSKYEISHDEWRDFRLFSFETHTKAFQHGSTGPVVPLLFNRIETLVYPVEAAWVRANASRPFGVKTSGVGRGHHLSNTRHLVQEWRPQLVDPPPGKGLFARSEMDQTWRQPYYSLNVPLGFYWGAISGLQVGLGVWDVTESALKVRARV